MDDNGIPPEMKHRIKIVRNILIGALIIIGGWALYVQFFT